jgi:hypothetical protein
MINPQDQQRHFEDLFVLDVSILDLRSLAFLEEFEKALVHEIN